MWTFLLFGFLVSAAYVALAGFTVTDSRFWHITILRVAIDSLAVITYFKALKIEEVSYITPIFAIQPIIIAITSYFINNEIPTNVALWGILAIVVGALIIFTSKIDFSTIKANAQLFKATSLTLFTVIIWSIASALHKQGVSYSSSATYFFVSYAGFVLIFTLIAYFVAREDMKKALNPKNRRVNIGNGIALGFDQAFTLTAISTGVVAYIEAIKSSSVMFTSILAFIYLKEKATLIKITGITTTFIGMLMVILGS